MSDQTTDLVAFLRACLDHDQRIAEEADGLGWHNQATTEVMTEPLDSSRPKAEPYWHHVATTAWGEVRGANARHISHNDPARVLAEVAAKRRILDLYKRALGDTRLVHHLAAAGAVVESENRHVLEYARALGHAVRALAQPYSGRSGWLPEWSMEAAERSEGT